MTKNNILRGLMAGVISLAWPMAIAQAQQAPVITPTGSEIVTCVASGAPKSCTTGGIAGLVNSTPQAATKVYAGPVSGSPVAPTFRNLQTSDLPIGTSGSTIPLLSGTNTWGASQTISADAFLQGASGVQRGQWWSTGSSPRWKISTDGTPETGSNSGSNLLFGAYGDSGSYLGTVFGIGRSNMATTFYNPLYAPTPSFGDSSTLVATTAFVQNGANANIALANCTNASGDGAVLQAALNTGRTVYAPYPCHIDQPVTQLTPGQIIYGSGRTTSIWTISPGLSVAALILNSGEPGPIIRDIGFYCPQPNVSTRSGLTNYTPAIKLVNASRTKLERLRISQCMTGIDATTGNAGTGAGSGGSVFNDLELGNMSVDIAIDNTVDSIKILNSHFWPFGSGGTIMSNNLQTIRNAVNTSCTPQTTSGTNGAIGIYSGRMDDLKVANTVFLTGQGVCLFTGSGVLPGPTFGTFSNIDFDTWGGINMASGYVTIASAIFTLADAAHNSIQMTGGNLQCSSCNFSQGLSYTSQPVISLGNGAAFSLSNGYIDAGNADIIFLQNTSSGYVTINGLQVHALAATQTQSKINISGSAIANIHGVQPINSVTSANLINIGADNYHNVSGNALNAGWNNACAAVVHATYGLNGSASPSTCN